MQRTVLNGPWPLRCRYYRNCREEDYRGRRELWKTEAVVAALEADRGGEAPEVALALADSLAERVDRLRRRTGQPGNCSDAAIECLSFGEITAILAYRSIWHAERRPGSMFERRAEQKFRPSDQLLAAVSIRLQQLDVVFRARVNGVKLIRPKMAYRYQPIERLYSNCYPDSEPAQHPPSRAQQCIQAFEQTFREYPELQEEPMMVADLTALHFELAAAAAASDQWVLAEEALAQGMAGVAQQGFVLVEQGYHGPYPSPIFYGLTVYALADLRRQGRIP